VPTLVLASASPARRATLSAAGLDPVVLVSAVDEPAEVARAGVTDAADVVLLLARRKAEDVAARDDLPDDAVVLGCDSVLDLGGEALGKPRDAADAAARWRDMRGRSGFLLTGHWLVDGRDPDDPDDPGTGATLGAVAATTVHFADVGDAEIDAYVATGEPLAVAGAFTVDGLGGAFVRGVEGDHHNVVGVSLPLLRDLLAEVGIAWPDLWRRDETDQPG
jgi:septum formation protein